MRDYPEHQQSSQQARATEVTPKDREDRKQPSYDSRNDGDADNPQICRGID